MQLRCLPLPCFDTSLSGINLPIYNVVVPGEQNAGYKESYLNTYSSQLSSYYDIHA